ncbi:MAG: hypothetical protein RSA78_02585, partial [Oscillospiraceae bacterium]
ALGLICGGFLTVSFFYHYGRGRAAAPTDWGEYCNVPHRLQNTATLQNPTGDYFFAIAFDKLKSRQWFCLEERLL